MYFDFEVALRRSPLALHLHLSRRLTARPWWHGFLPVRVSASRRAVVPSRQRPHFENNAFRYVRDRSILSTISEEGAASGPLPPKPYAPTRGYSCVAPLPAPRRSTGLGFRRVNTAQATPLNRGHKQALRHASETPQSSERVQHRALSRCAPRTYTYTHKHT